MMAQHVVVPNRLLHGEKSRTLSFSARAHTSQKGQERDWEPKLPGLCLPLWDTVPGVFSYRSLR